MSVLDEVLKEEYERLLRMRSAMSIEYDALPKGSISRKNIRGCDCYYLQYRERDKIVSKYIKKQNWMNSLPRSKKGESSERPCATSMRK